MNGKKIGYWIVTVLVALGMLGGGIFDASQQPAAVEILKHLGFPAYFGTIIGVWKILGVIAILAPRFPRVKEWAYAGFVFDLTGAVVAHSASGDGAKEIMTPIVFLAFVAASYVLRPESRRLGSAAPAATASAPVSQPAAPAVMS